MRRSLVAILLAGGLALLPAAAGWATAEKSVDRNGAAEHAGKPAAEHAPEKAAADGADNASAADAGEKVGEKAAEKSADKSAGKTAEKLAEKRGEKVDEAEKPAGGKGGQGKASGKASSSAAGKPQAKVGQGPSPASPPPLAVSNLREEMRREPGPAAIDSEAPPRTKIEQMLSEVSKARESLRDDTQRLEEMLASESGAGGGGQAAGGGAPGAGARPPAKHPLDVVAKALRGIKPEQAAPIVTRLDRRLAASVLQRMPPVDAGKILGALKPDVAAELATQIASRPVPGEAKR